MKSLHGEGKSADIYYFLSHSLYLPGMALHALHACHGLTIHSFRGYPNRRWARSTALSHKLLP